VNQNNVLIAGVVLFGMFTIVALMLREKTLSRVWLEEAFEALGAGWSPFADDEDLPGGVASKGKLAGADARFWVDNTRAKVRLDIGVPDGVDRGQVYNLIVRDAGGSLDSEGVSVGWDDDTKQLVFRGPGFRGDAATSVGTIVDAAKDFRDGLPALLEKHAERRRQIAGQAFGPHTAADGRHKALGLALALETSEWELTRAGKDGRVFWEMIEQGESARPVELELSVEPQDPALGDAGARERLLDRIAQGRAERLPDGSFEGPTPEIHATSGEPVAGFPTARATIDHARELELDEDRSEAAPYRVSAVAVFAPWAVAVFELTAPRDQADALLSKLLAKATFVEPPKA
jgi:hypothetical protein